MIESDQESERERDDQAAGKDSAHPSLLQHNFALTRLVGGVAMSRIAMERVGEAVGAGRLHGKSESGAGPNAGVPTKCGQSLGVPNESDSWCKFASPSLHNRRGVFSLMTLPSI